MCVNIFSYFSYVVDTHKNRADGSFEQLKQMLKLIGKFFFQNYMFKNFSYAVMCVQIVSEHRFSFSK